MCQALKTVLAQSELFLMRLRWSGDRHASDTTIWGTPSNIFDTILSFGAGLYICAICIDTCE
jgi:hypothetical protein